MPCSDRFKSPAAAAISAPFINSMYRSAGELPSFAATSNSSCALRRIFRAGLRCFVKIVQLLGDLLLLGGCGDRQFFHRLRRGFHGRRGFGDRGAAAIFFSGVQIGLIVAIGSGR